MPAPAVSGEYSTLEMFKIHKFCFSLPLFLVLVFFAAFLPGWNAAADENELERQLESDCAKKFSKEKKDCAERNPDDRDVQTGFYGGCMDKAALDFKECMDAAKSKAQSSGSSPQKKVTGKEDLLKRWSF